MGIWDNLGKVAVGLGKELGKTTMQKVEEMKAYNDDLYGRSESELKSIYVSAKRSKNHMLAGAASAALKRDYDYSDFQVSLLLED